MRVNVAGTQTDIEVGQYRAMDKGSLKAFFTIIEYPTGRKTLDCSYFTQGDRRWFNFPQKEIKKQGEEKKDYIPLVSYLDKAYLEKFKEAVMTALIHKEKDEQDKTHQKQANPLQDDASSLWFG